MQFQMRILAILLLSFVRLEADETQDLQKYLQQRFLKQVLTIRNFYGGDHLIFDSQGALLEGDKTVGHDGCWCAAQLEIQQIDIKKDQLILSGPRIVGVYDSKKKAFSKLLRDEGKVQLDIKLDGAQMDEQTVTSAMQKIFLTRKDDLDSLIPDAWRAADFSPAEHEITTIKKDAASPEENVSAPKPIHTPDPGYSEAARTRRIQGVLTLWVVVDEKGNVARIRINQCLGGGLDKEAVQAVSHWKFKPALKNGQPIAVQLNVAVTFHLNP
ncbi:MAG TPA: energy transducer TonB [Terriglobales bacterium]|jgi:TonB family protein|nr:energy transducer TonB [Terriglobales bacterium]